MRKKKLNFNCWLAKNRHYTKNIIKKYLTNFPIEMVEDVYPIPGAGQDRPLPLLLPPHVQIEDYLLNGGPCPAWISCKSSSCGEVCYTQALCVC